MPMGRGCNMPRQACCVDTIQQVAWHESGPLRCESNNGLPGRLSLQQKPTCPGTNEAQQPDHVSQTTTVTSCDGACVQITSAQSDLGEASMRSVGELSGSSECRVRTGAIFLTSEEAEKIESPMPYRRVSECGV
jgi:hypothetical protein